MLRRAIGGGIGLAQEAYYHNKDKKAKASSGGEQDPTVDGTVANASNDKDNDVVYINDNTYWEMDEATWSNAPPDYGAVTGEESLMESQSVSDTMTEDDETKKKKKKPKKTLDLFIQGYEVRHPGLLQQRYDPTAAEHLLLPVVLPQRRPTSRSRGFIRGYPPVLQPRGLEVVDWFDFLDTLDQAIKTSPWFWVVNISLKAGHLIPSVWVHFVITAAHAGVEAARRYKMVMNTNNFLADANERFFKPLGLYCLLMQYNPESKDPVEAVDIQARMKEIAMAADKKANDEDRNMSRRFADKLRIADGKSLGELELPEAAELVFPDASAIATDPLAQNHLTNGEGEGTGSQPSRWARTKAFTADYYDKRSQATYNAQHPDSKLTVTEEPTFQGRWADPNHAANNGSPLSLLSGGIINPSHGIAHRTLGRVRNRGMIGKMKRVIEGKVIYLVVTDMPTEEEIRHAEAKLQEEGVANGGNGHSG